MPTPPGLREEADRIRSIERTYAEYDDDGELRGRGARRRQYDENRETKYPGQPRGKVREGSLGLHNDYKDLGERVESADRRYGETRAREESRMGRRSSRSRARYTGTDDLDKFDSLANLRLGRRADEAVQREIPSVIFQICASFCLS
jgi:hypothetical protein